MEIPVRIRQTRIRQTRIRRAAGNPLRDSNVRRNPLATIAAKADKE
jgi:hypothetical protein